MSKVENNFNRVKIKSSDRFAIRSHYLIKFDLDSYELHVLMALRDAIRANKNPILPDFYFNFSNITARYFTEEIFSEVLRSLFKKGFFVFQGNDLVLKGGM